MERSIDRFYLHLLNYKDLIRSNCKEKNLEILLEKKQNIDLFKFFYKYILKYFKEDIKNMNKDNYIFSDEMSHLSDLEIEFKDLKN